MSGNPNLFSILVALVDLKTPRFSRALLRSGIFVQNGVERVSAPFTVVS